MKVALNTINLKPKHKPQFLLFLLLTVTDCLQQVENYVRGCTWQLKKIKTIYRFLRLVHVFHSRDRSLACFIGTASSSSISYEEKSILICFWNIFLILKAKKKMKMLESDTRLTSKYYLINRAIMVVIVYMVVRFTTIYAIRAYHYESCEFESRWWWGVLYVIKLANGFQQVGGFLLVLLFPSPIKLTTTK